MPPQHRCELQRARKLLQPQTSPPE